MIDYAAEHKISRIDLMATDEGYPIYKKLGFEDKVQKYKDMRLVVVNQWNYSRKLCAFRACEQPKSGFLCETECEDGRLLSD